MSMTDPIADMLARIKNGQKGKFLKISLPASTKKISILKILKEEGYIKDYELIGKEEKKPTIEIILKYSKEGMKAIKEIERISKPSKRIYSAIKNLKGCYNNMGIWILSTSKGVMSDATAHRMGIGGEVVCKVF